MHITTKGRRGEDACCRRRRGGKKLGFLIH